MDSVYAKALVCIIESCAYRHVWSSCAFARVDYEGRGDHVGVEPLRAHGIQDLHRLAPLIAYVSQRQEKDEYIIIY
jgi:hypothetical protein